MEAAQQGSPRRRHGSQEMSKVKARLPRARFVRPARPVCLAAHLDEGATLLACMFFDWVPVGAHGVAGERALQQHTRPGRGGQQRSHSPGFPRFGGACVRARGGAPTGAPVRYAFVLDACSTPRVGGRRLADCSVSPTSHILHCAPRPPMPEHCTCCPLLGPACLPGLFHTHRDASGSPRLTPRVVRRAGLGRREHAGRDSRHGFRRRGQLTRDARPGAGERRGRVLQRAGVLAVLGRRQHHAR